MPKAECAIPIDRREERTHVLIVATLYFGQTSIPIRVRNLSASGALIEGICLPPMGTEIILRRGNLKASGVAVWTASEKSGISFHSPVAVSPWLPTKVPAGQREVDQLVLEIKHGGSAVEVAQALSIDDAKLSIPPVVAELESLQVDLSKLGDKLAQDIILVATHPEVQFLDEAVQRIAKIVKAIQAA